MTQSHHWPLGPCKGPNCQAQVIWAETAQLRPMPVDAEPVKWPAGNLLLRERDPGQPPRVKVVTNPGKAFGRLLYRSHFATCVNADMFRPRTTTRRRSRA